MTYNQEKDELEQQYYPLLTAIRHEMEGKTIAYVENNYTDMIDLVLVDGTKINFNRYRPQREDWDRNGYTDADGKTHRFPKCLYYDDDWYAPLPDIDDADQTVKNWRLAQKRLERSQQPLTVSTLSGESVELNDWATKLDLVAELQTQFPDYEWMEGDFRLLLEVPINQPEGAEGGEGREAGAEEETYFLDISYLNSANWHTILEGDMPLEVVVEYLDDEQTNQKMLMQQRAQTPLSFHTPTQQGKYTLEGWAPSLFYVEDRIHLQDMLKRKYPELKSFWSMELQMQIPGYDEPQDISNISQQTLRMILEADTPLEVRLVSWPCSY